jgi:hypothetical protein
MSAIAPSETFYHLRLGQQETGPFTLGQLRSMWQSGAITADTAYRFDPSSDWQPLIQLRRVLEPAPTSAAPRSVPPPLTQPTQSLVLPIVALILAFIPGICIAGVICAHIALARRRTSNDSTARIIAIIALVIGYLSVLNTVFGSLILFSPASPLRVNPIPSLE